MATAITGKGKPAKKWANKVDELADLLSQKADIESREKAIKAELAESGEAEIESADYRCTISRFDKRNTAWKEVAVACKASAQLIAVHTTTSEQVAVKISSR